MGPERIGHRASGNVLPREDTIRCLAALIGEREQISCRVEDERWRCWPSDLLDVDHATPAAGGTLMQGQASEGLVPIAIVRGRFEVCLGRSLGFHMQELAALRELFLPVSVA